MAKIVPRAEGVEAPALMISDTDWRSSTTAEKGWEQAGFHDAAWKPVEAFGGIESNIEMFQWNADAGLYDWPGYDGISRFLAHMPLRAMSVMASYAGRGSFDGPESLTSGDGEVVVQSAGREAGGCRGAERDAGLWARADGKAGDDSDSDDADDGDGADGRVGVGGDEGAVPGRESDDDSAAWHGALAEDRVPVCADAISWWGEPDLRVKSIHADHIYYPVKYEGSFESSDALLNRIWETGAYTAHLCMQDGVWDASKRDRGRWMGDTDVSGPVIEDVFVGQDADGRHAGPVARRGPEAAGGSACERDPGVLVVLVYGCGGLLPAHGR